MYFIQIKKDPLPWQIVFSVFIALIMTMISVSTYAQSKTFERYKSHNNIQFEYTVLLPKNFDNHKAYETIVAFAGHEAKKDKAVWSLDQLWANHQNYPYIIVVPKVPLGKQHWISHPIHHGLNDFLEHLKKNYKVKDGKFHFLGYKDGCIPAQTYITMLNYPPASLTVFSSEYWDHYNKSTYDGLAKLKIPVNLFFTEGDTKRQQVQNKVVKELRARGTQVSFEVIETPAKKLESLLKPQDHGRP